TTSVADARAIAHQPEACRPPSGAAVRPHLVALRTTLSTHRGALAWLARHGKWRSSLDRVTTPDSPERCAHRLSPGVTPLLSQAETPSRTVEPLLPPLPTRSSLPKPRPRRSHSWPRTRPPVGRLSGRVTCAWFIQAVRSRSSIRSKKPPQPSVARSYCSG